MSLTGSGMADRVSVVQSTQQEAEGYYEYVFGLMDAVSEGDAAFDPEYPSVPLSAQYADRCVPHWPHFEEACCALTHGAFPVGTGCMASSCRFVGGACRHRPHAPEEEASARAAGAAPGRARAAGS
jgi:hypothetical protein